MDGRQVLHHIPSFVQFAVPSLQSTLYLQISCDLSKVSIFSQYLEWLETILCDILFSYLLEIKKVTVVNITFFLCQTPCSPALFLHNPTMTCPGHFLKDSLFLFIKARSYCIFVMFYVVFVHTIFWGGVEFRDEDA